MARIYDVPRYCSRRKQWAKPIHLTELDVPFSVLDSLDASIGIIKLWFQCHSHTPIIRHQLWPIWANLDRHWTSSTSPEWCQNTRKHALKSRRTQNGKAVTVNGDRYRAMLNEFWTNIWLQQDGATCHTAEGTLNVLRSVFEDRIINIRADVVWGPRNCDLTPLDYYLWGSVKVKCYAGKLETIYALKDNIREAIGEYNCTQSIMSLKIRPIV